MTPLATLTRLVEAARLDRDAFFLVLGMFLGNAITLATLYVQIRCWRRTEEQRRG